MAPVISRWGYKLARMLGRQSCRIAALSPYIARRRREFRPGDVFLASYPRSGNTWSRLLLTDLALQFQGREAGPKINFPMMHALIPAVERSNDLEIADAPFRLQPRIFKTHEYYHRAMGRAIVVYRLPAASLVSNFHFHRSHGPLARLTAVGIDAFCRSLASDWVQHLQSYADAIETGRLNALLISYERLHSEPVAALLDVCRYLGWAEDSTVCQQAVTHAQFGRCQAEAAVRFGVKDSFYRRGQTHGFHEELEERTIAFLDRYAAPIYQRVEQLAAAQRAVLPARQAA